MDYALNTNILASSAYALGMIACACAARAAGRRGQSRMSRFWAAGAALQLLFGAEVWLAMRHSAGAAIAQFAKAHGWYQRLHECGQAYALAVSGLLMLFLAMALLWRLRRSGWGASLAAMGSVLSLSSLVIAPVISLHAVDRISYRHIGPVMLIAIVWAAGGLAAAAGGFAYCRKAMWPVACCGGKNT